jgi:hypothetical protein
MHRQPRFDRFPEGGKKSGGEWEIRGAAAGAIIWAAVGGAVGAAVGGAVGGIVGAAVDDCEED